MNEQPKPYWNPYLAGIGLGLVLLASFVIVGRGLGASGAFSTLVSAGIAKILPAHAAQNIFIPVIWGMEQQVLSKIGSSLKSLASSSAGIYQEF